MIQDPFLFSSSDWDDRKASDTLADVETMVVADYGVADDLCSLCLQPFADETDPKRFLVCGHGFHAECISTWTQHENTALQNLRCPVCKASQNENDQMAEAQSRSGAVAVDNASDSVAETLVYDVAVSRSSEAEHVQDGATGAESVPETEDYQGEESSEEEYEEDED